MIKYYDSDQMKTMYEYANLILALDCTYTRQCKKRCFCRGGLDALSVLRWLRPDHSKYCGNPLFSSSPFQPTEMQ